MHPLEVILQLQLGSDQTAALLLPSIVSAITSAHFEASPHLQKWISRVTSLIHSKHPGARWAGLCLALRTSTLNKDLMIECAQGWIGITLPMLSRNETPPIWKACIRLLGYIFASAVDMPEFQRQIATPNIPKFSTALISLAEKSDNPTVRHTTMATLTHLIPLYPTLHRTLQPSLSSLSLNLLSGSSTSPTPHSVIEDACGLHAVLHFTGGKVGAAPLWRKNLDTGLANARFALAALRTTFPSTSMQPTLDGIPTDPVVAIPLSLDRLKCAIRLIGKLLQAVTLRPVLVPVGDLVKLSLHLLRCTVDETKEEHLHATRRALEISAIPDIWQLGCELVAKIVKSLRHYLNPHLARIISHITYHLEQPISISLQIPFLRVLQPLLENTHALHVAILPTRLTKALLPFLTVFLTSRTEVQQQLQENSTTNKKSKKRARTYEGEEVFALSRRFSCPTLEDGEAVVATLNALNSLMANPYLDPAIRSLASRLLVTLMLELPRYPAATLSPDLTLHGRVYARVLALCQTHVLSGASGWINSAVGLVVNAVGKARDGSETVMHAAEEAQRALDVLLHPRLPPLLRTHPPLEAVVLFRSESEKADREARETLALGLMEDLRTTAESAAATATKTTTNEPITRAVKSAVSATLPQQAQSWSTTGSDAATAIVPESTVPVVEVPPISPIMTQVSGPSTIAEQAAPTSILPLCSVHTQQEAAVASTSSQVFRATQDESSDDTSEEMPEIDMRSDSD